MILFFDTETTGLIKPYIVQLGCILTDDNCEVISECCILVAQTKQIEEGATKAHGKTNEQCLKGGIDERVTIELFQCLFDKCDTLVAHNLKYDKGVISNHIPLFLEHTKTEFCTMEATTDILKLPQKNGNYMRRSGYKWPKLEEAYEYFFHKKLEGAHNALTDCRATLEVYRKLMNPSIVNRAAIMDNGTVRID
jgi:DNA polymerase III subunit epsilon